MNKKDTVYMLNKFQSILQKLVSKQCWYVSAGRNTGSSFCMPFGRKIARKEPTENIKLSMDYRNNDGEYNLWVWCSWRLEHYHKVIVTSDDCNNNTKWCYKLDSLIGEKVKEIEILSPAGDLFIGFSGGKNLKIFCDHGNLEPSLNTNWSLVCIDFRLQVNAGAKLEIIDEERN